MTIRPNDSYLIITVHEAKVISGMLRGYSELLCKIEGQKNVEMDLLLHHEAKEALEIRENLRKKIEDEITFYIMPE